MNPAIVLAPSRLITLISGWIKSYAIKSGISTLVVGVSGGIDSAVVTRLCQETDLRVCAVAMPMWLHSNDGDPTALQRAMELCVGQPNLDFHIREIGSILESYLLVGAGGNHLSASTGPDRTPMWRLLQGNLRARIRANILCDFAGATNGIVVGTGNLDEDEIGYFTKWGDGAVDICPLSKLHKSKLYEMAGSLNIPLSIRNISPTAGLWCGQTDEQELGMTYAEVEWALDYDEQKDLIIVGPDGKPELSTRQHEVLEMVRDRRRKNAHKLHYPPVFDPFTDEL